MLNKVLATTSHPNTQRCQMNLSKARSCIKSLTILKTCMLHYPVQLLTCKIASEGSEGSYQPAHFASLSLSSLLAQNLMCWFIVLSVTAHINALSHVGLINVVYLYQIIMMLHFLNDVLNDIKSTRIYI